MATEIASQDQALAGVADVHSLKTAVVDSKVADQSPSINTACNSTGSPVQEPVKNEAAAAEANTTNEPNDAEDKTQVPTPTHAAVSGEDVKGESDSPAAAGNETDQATAEGTEADPASGQAETATNGGEKRPREESACEESDTAAAEGSAVEQDSEAQSSAKKQNTSTEQE